MGILRCRKCDKTYWYYYNTDYIDVCHNCMEVLECVQMKEGDSDGEKGLSGQGV